MSTPRSVAFVAPYPPPTGGMTLLAEGLCGGLEREGVSVRRLDTVGRRVGDLFRFYLACIGAIRRAELVHIIGSSGRSLEGKCLPAVVVARMFKKPVLLNFVGGMAVEVAPDWPWFKHTPFTRSNAVVVPTSTFAAGLQDAGIRARFAVIPNLVAVEPFLESARVDRGPVLLAAKGLVEYAGHDHLLEAFRRVVSRHPHAELWIAGEGPERQRLEEMASAMGLEGVTFLGDVSRDRMPALFAKAAVFVHATRYESFGIALVEAMASGVPVVAFAVGGIPDVVPHERAGILVRYGDVAALALAVERLLDDHDLNEKLGRAGRSEAEAYSWRALWPRWRALYGSMLGDGAAQAVEYQVKMAEHGD